MSKFNSRTNRMEKRVARAIRASGSKKKIHVIYSAFNSDENDDPVDNLDEVAVKGKVVLTQKVDNYWADKKSKDYRSQVLENPTWLQVAVCANEMICSVRDGHHVFLEGLYKAGMEDDVTIYKFAMGS